MRISLAAVLAVAVTLPSLGMAGTPGFYAGIGAGGAKLNANINDIGAAPAPTTVPPPNGNSGDLAAIGSDFDGDDLGSQYFVGYRFSEYLGVEGGYVNFGQIKKYYQLPDACNSRGCQSRQWTVEDETDGFELYVTGSYPLTKMLDLYGKLGALNWDAKYSGSEQVRDIVPSPPAGLPGPQNARVSNSDNGTDLAVALGVEIKTEGHFSLRPELAWYDIKDTDGLWFLSLNAIYNF